MHALNLGEILEWCESRMILFSDSGFPYFEQEERYEILYEQKVDQAYSVTYLASHPFPWSEGDLSGDCMVWIYKRDYWGEALEKLGEQMAKDLRAAWSITDSLSVTPGIVFTAKEKYQLWSYSTLPYLFGWDAFVIPESGNYFAFISNEETVHLVTRTKEMQEKFLHSLTDRNPRVDDGSYFEKL